MIPNFNADGSSGDEGGEGEEVGDGDEDGDDLVNGDGERFSSILISSLLLL